MGRPVRKTGINGARLRHLRGKEQWTQTDLANRLGVHRATLARWEAGDGDAPYEVAEQMADLFKVPPGYLFEADPVDLEGENPQGVILDPVLKRFSLAKLQKNTRPALEASGITLKLLSRKLPKVPVERLQEILNGQKPTAAEIQLLKNNLGADFNPISPLKRRILAETKPAQESKSLAKAKTDDVKLELLLVLAEQVVLAVEQTSKAEGLNSQQKKQQALDKLSYLTEGLGLNTFPQLLDIFIEASLQRFKSGQERYAAEIARQYGVPG